jgi:hypothetical protein
MKFSVHVIGSRPCSFIVQEQRLHTVLSRTSKNGSILILSYKWPVRCYSRGTIESKQSDQDFWRLGHGHHHLHPFVLLLSFHPAHTHVDLLLVESVVVTQLQCLQQASILGQHCGSRSYDKCVILVVEARQLLPELICHGYSAARGTQCHNKYSLQDWVTICHQGQLSRCCASGLGATWWHGSPPQ